jgi:hypothetical protein
VATATPVLLIAGWWYLRNIQLYGDVTGINAFIDVLGKRAAPASLLQLWGERWGFMLSYWGLFGGVNVPIDDWGYHLFNGLAILAVVGVVVYLVTMTWQWFRDEPIHSWRDFTYVRDYAQARALFLVTVWRHRRDPVDTMGARHVVIAGRLVFSAISTGRSISCQLATIATAFCQAVALVGAFMFVFSALVPLRQLRLRWRSLRL